MSIASGSSSPWERLLELVAALRGPQGCPWDRAQTTVSLSGHLVEEAYEVMESARRGAQREIEEEIGDAAFLLALVQCELAEKGGASFAEILTRTNEKILRRHPHVFGDRRVADAQEAARLWEEVKRAERGNGADEPPVAPGSLNEPTPALPALLQAQRIQEKAAAVGFDWPEASAVLPKLAEELAELESAWGEGGENRSDRIREELGDLLFSAVNLARALDLDAEETLRAATRKFRRRFNLMAEEAVRQGAPLHELTLAEMEAIWTIVKERERAPGVSAPSARESSARESSARESSARDSIAGARAGVRTKSPPWDR